jgi:hypothetical protein
VGCAAAAITPTTEPNMNGEYLLAPTPKAPNPKWSTNFKDYPGGVESFTVYAGPITSTYAEVFWTSLPEVNLPDDIVKRFKGKGMAVVGFEADQVRKGAGPNGEDVSVREYGHQVPLSMLHTWPPDTPTVAEASYQRGVQPPLRGHAAGRRLPHGACSV